MSVRVLLVDDHRDARTALAQRLRRHPELMLVGVASGLEEAVQLLPEARASIVLLDIRGQDGGGVEGCRILRELTDAPVVIFTSFMTDDLWAAAREAGAADYLLKHIDTEQLSRKIIRLAEQHQAGRHRE
jgi:DNA-binding NarL/FixJ family response regulator